MPKRPRPPPALPRLTGPQTCWREKTHEEALKAALDAGIITAADFSQQVRAHRSAPEQLVQAPTRKRKIRGGALVQAKCYTGLWEPVIAGPFKDHKEALGARAEVESGGNAGEWTSNNEGGGSHKYYRCNRHKACPVMLRAKGPKYDVGLEVLDLAHSLELNPKRRKNSPLTFEQEVEFKDHIEMGVRPGKYHDKLTEEAIANGKRKLDNGGMEGTLPGVCCVIESGGVAGPDSR